MPSFSISDCRAWTGWPFSRNGERVEEAFPILVLTARGTWSERVEGIDAGARTTTCRSHSKWMSFWRGYVRSSAAPPGHAAPFAFNSGRYSGPEADARHGRTVCPNPCRLRSISLLSYLMLHAGRVVPQQELAEQLHGAYERPRIQRCRSACRPGPAQAWRRPDRDPQGLRLHRPDGRGMMAGSLRLRLFMASTAAVAVALVIAGIGLVFLFERHVERRIGTELDTYLNQMAARVVFNADGSFALRGTLADPRFDKIFSGLYWQIGDKTAGTYARSRSLWDTKLDLPQDMPAVGAIHVHTIPGPQDSRLLTHERRLAFAASSGEKILRLAVAIDRADVDALSEDFARDVGLSLLLLFAVLIVAAWAQVNVGLKRLNAIREGLAGIRDGKTDRLQIDVPSEIAPLVSEVNSLLNAQEESIQRARDRAADLAHGFKTPLTALLADAKRLRNKGQAEIADEIEQTGTDHARPYRARADPFAHAQCEHRHRRSRPARLSLHWSRP